MDYSKLIGAATSSMGKGETDATKSKNTELSSMLGELGVSLDEEAKNRDASYADAFTRFRESQNRQLADREMAAGAAANAAANAAGPAPRAPSMASGAAMGGGPVQGSDIATKAAMARQAMGQGGAQPVPGNLGAPGPSAALQNVQVDPRTGLAGAAMGPSPAELAAAQQATIGGMQQPVAYPTMQQPDTAAMMAAYQRNRGF